MTIHNKDIESNYDTNNSSNNIKVFYKKLTKYKGLQGGGRTLT